MSELFKSLTFTKQTSYRLINSKFPPTSLFDDVADAEDFDAIYAIQALTNPRLQNELGNLNLLPTEEIPFGINGVNYVTAPFTHVNPQGSRFSDGSFGMLYLADSEETAIKESRYHQERYLQKIKGLHFDTISMRCLKVVFSNDVIDCRTIADIYHPLDYTKSRLLGNELKKSGYDGLYYNSVRHPEAHCWAMYTPKGVLSAIQTKHNDFIFDGRRISHIKECKKIN